VQCASASRRPSWTRCFSCSSSPGSRACSPSSASSVRPPPSARRCTFWGVFLLSATNPYQLAWWASGGVALLARTGWTGAVAFLAAVYAWVLLFAAAMARGAQRWDWFQPLVQVVAADALLAYALRLAVRAA
jgi:threonine/homoserine/homoserine lactone efflux protein